VCPASSNPFNDTKAESIVLKSSTIAFLTLAASAAMLPAHAHAESIFAAFHHSGGSAPSHPVIAIIAVLISI
jgi:hypothetical protein